VTYKFLRKVTSRFLCLCRILYQIMMMMMVKKTFQKMKIQMMIWTMKRTNRILTMKALQVMSSEQTIVQDIGVPG